MNRNGIGIKVGGFVFPGNNIYLCYVIVKNAYGFPGLGRVSGVCLFVAWKNRCVMAKVNYITEAGLRKLRGELDALKAERPVISAQIAEARDKGDLSENAEYDAAKEAQGMLEMRIAKLEAMIAGARIIDESKLNTDSIQMLNRVTIKNMNVGKTVEYTIVSENEANLKEGKLSIGTPIAQALLGKKRGDVVEVQVPSGILKLEVLDISI